MTVLMANLWSILFMGLLLLFSGLFSGSETAFFNLSRRQVEKLKTSKGNLHRISAGLISRQKPLLNSLLMGNMAVNTLYCALSGIVTVSLSSEYNPAAGTVFGILSFVMLLMFGEMLPKSIAYNHSIDFCLVSSPVCYAVMYLLKPLISVFNLIIVSPAVRLIVGPMHKKSGGNITADHLKLLIDSVRQQGIIGHHEYNIFGQVIELGTLKVRHVSRPRVDMITCRVDNDPADALRLMREHDRTKICVYDRDIDNIIGFVQRKDIILNENSKLADLVKDIIFVPEQKSVESLLTLFRTRAIDTAVVVDEYGGITGSVCVEDIAEEIIGEIEQSSGIEPVTQIGPLKYRLAGNLSIHEWANSFGINIEHSRISSMGGLAVSLLGHVPKAGDTACLENIKLTVEEVENHRVKSLILSVEPITSSQQETE